MQQKTVLFLNAPPGVGKDMVCDHLKGAYGQRLDHREMKARLFELCLSISKIPEDVWWDRYDNVAGTKDIPWELLPTRLISEGPICAWKHVHMTQREFMIHVSEVIMKPLYGKDYFGRFAAKGVRDSDVLIHAFSDGGFLEEIECLKPACDRLVIVRLHRKGHDFAKDSRTYVYSDDPDIEQYDIQNNSTKHELFRAVREIITWRK